MVADHFYVDINEIQWLVY